MCSSASERGPSRARRPSFCVLSIALMAAACAACRTPPAALTRLLEARGLASELHVQFTRAADAANRAVMAEADPAAANAAAEARRARQVVERDIETLHPLLQSLGYRSDLSALDGFTSRFAEYRRLDDEVLPLAEENTNVKAQRLSFGQAQAAADGFRLSLDDAVQAAAPADRCRADALAARAGMAILEIQALHPPHIAEADDAAMTRMEGKMDAAAAAARTALDDLNPILPPSAGPRLAAADEALRRFMAVHARIITLSRRNSDVRSLALSLGRKRVVTAGCEEQLQALEDGLAKHAFTATR